VLERKDVFAVLPTGFGKSLIFRVFAEAKTSQLQQEVSVLIISPLVSIIQDQILEAKSLEISCSSLKEMSYEAPPKLIFASAEEVTEKNFHRVLKDQNSALNKQLELIVVDESHTIETWTGAR